MKWTEAQERVINERNCNLLVSAAAGSGKTAVLVERIIKRLCDDDDKISLDRLLVMTFTKAAAEEMRERIGRALSERIKADPENKDLLLQKTLLPRAKISTIDSICQNLIKQNYQYLDIDPGFRVPDDGELKLLKEDIISEMMEEYYETEDSRFEDFAEAFGGAGADERLSEIILVNANILNSNPWPELVLEEQLKECKKEQKGDYEETAWFKLIMEDVKSFTSEYIENLEYARELCYEPEGPMPYLENIDELLELGEDILSAKTYQNLYDILRNFKAARLKTVRGNKYDSSVKDIVKKYIDEFKSYIKEQLIPVYTVLNSDEVGHAVSEAAFNNEIVLRLAGEFNRRFESKKREKNLVDFSDMEHLALKLLYKEKDGEMVPDSIADILSEQFDEILIDEYQDSNFVQEALIQALSGERFGRSDVFMVGDVKQSIYRFRLAKPELFMEKYDSYKDSGSDIKIELNQNFRSRSEVISSVNSIFSRVMRRELGGVEYDENQSLKLGASYPDSVGNETELCIINTKSEEDDSNGDKDIYEAKFIADRINQMVGRSLIDEGKSAFMVTDKSSGELRKASYGDIVILMRAPGGRAEKFARELNYAGIPVYYENSKGYFDAPEIEIILSYLNIIDNPNQDIPLTAALRSVIGGLNDSELAYIRSIYNSKTEEELISSGNMYDAVFYFAREWKENDKRGSIIKEKCINFLNRLELYRSLSAFLPVHVLLYRIYRETGYYECMSAMPLGKIRRKNLDMLLQRAENYSRTSMHGLFSFVRYIERLRENKSDYGSARVIEENDDIVRIVSIHKSKGLEYPIVFLSGMGKLFNRQDLNEKIVTEGDIGVASDYYDLENRLKYPVLKKDAIKRKKKLDDLGEELRVLYVAMTRAKEKLIMTAAISNPESKLKKFAVNFPQQKLPAGIIASAHCYLDWVLMSTSEENTDIDIKLIERGELEISESDEENLKNSIYEDVSELPSSEFVSDSFVGDIKNRLNKKYAFEKYLDLRPKLSVSEIKEGVVAIEASGDEADEAEVKKRKERAALRGNAFHRFMELIDYGEYRRLLNRKEEPEEPEILEFLEKEKKRIVDTGYMPKTEACVLDSRLAVEFFKTETAKNIAFADERGKLRREQRFMIGFRAGEKIAENIEEYRNAIVQHRKIDISGDNEIQLLQGIADCMYEDSDGRIVIVDYKTDKVENKEKLIERYFVQLIIYAVSISQILDKEIADCIIYSTSLKTAFSVLYS